MPVDPARQIRPPGCHARQRPVGPAPLGHWPGRCPKNRPRAGGGVRTDGRHFLAGRGGSQRGLLACATLRSTAVPSRYRSRWCGRPAL